MKGTKALVLVGLALGGAVVSSAKEKAIPQLVPNPLQGISVRAGIFYPQTQFARDIEGGRWFVAGLGFDTTPHFGLFGVNAGTQFDIDYITKGSFTSVPITVNATFSAGDLFAGAGAGVGFNHRMEDSGASTSDAAFAYKVFAGYTLVKGPFPVFIQGTYFGSGQSDLSGFALSLGVKF